MTPLFKFSLLGLGAASAGGGVICISKRDAIREYFRGPSNQTPSGSREGGKASGVQDSTQDTTTRTSTTDTQDTDLNNKGQDSNQGETRSPVPGEHQVDGSKAPLATEDQKVNEASETTKSPQDPAKLPESPRATEDNAVIPPPQPQPQQEQQLPSGNPRSKEDSTPGKPKGQESESVQGPKVYGGDAVDRPQKPAGEADPKINPQGGLPAPEGVDSVPGSKPNEVPGPASGEGGNPNATPKGREPSRDGTGLPGVEGPGAVGPTGNRDLSGQQKADGGPGAVEGGGGGSLPKGDRAQIDQGNIAPGSGASAPGPGGGAAPTEHNSNGPQPSPGVPRNPSNPAPVSDTTDYQCLFGGGSYDSYPNKKAIKEFLDSMGIKDKHGIQIHDDTYEKGFKCAKDMEDEKLAGLKDYMETEKTNFNTSPESRPDNGQTVWAFKKKDDKSGWTMYEKDSESEDEREETIIAKTAKSEKGSR